MSAARRIVVRLTLGLAIAAVVAGLAWWAWSAAPARVRQAAPLDATRPLPQGDFFVGPYTEPQSLNFFTAQDTVARHYVLRHTHDALFELDPATAELRPALATEVVSSADGREHVFTLRSGVRFADGSALTVDDALFTASAGRAEGVTLGALGEVLGLIESMQKVDGQRVRIVLRDANVRSFGIVATGYLIGSARWFRAEVARLARARGDAVPDGPGAPGFGALLSEAKMSGPGSGPYAIATDEAGAPAWRRGIDLTLVQNPHSWRRAARPRDWNLAGMRLLFLRDRAAQEVALRQEEIDWLAVSDPKTLLADPQIAASYRAVVSDHVQLGHYLVLWNHRRPGLADPRVRTALTMCFDRDGIREHLLSGHALPDACWFRPGSGDCAPELQPLPFDPAKARELLASAGFDPSAGRPLRLSLIYASTEELQRRIVELAQPSLLRAGVEVELSAMPFASMLARLEARDFDGMLVVMGLERWVDPYFVFHSSQADGGRNWMGYADAEVDRLLELARAERDDARRAESYRAFSRIFHRDQPVTLLVHPLSAVLLHRRFRDAQPGALGLSPERWWVEPERQLHR